MMASQVNLRDLAVDRSSSAAAPMARRRSWGTRYAMPLTILIAFAAVIGWSLRDSLLPAKQVTILPVVLAKAEVQQAGTPVFQAAGWIEPRPTATVASALVEGVVESLLVVEGQEVQKGQPLARLVDLDAKLALSEAKATLRLREAEVELAQATLSAARSREQNPVHLEAALAEAEATLAKVKTEVKNLPFTLKAAEARLRIAQQDLEGKKSVREAIAFRAVQRAQSEFDSATAAVHELVERKSSLDAEVQGWSRRCEALAEQLELKTEERRKVGEAEAQLKIANARRQQAQLAVEAAELRLDRMEVRSPISGKVLALHALPGRRLMGLSPASERDASAVVSLYEPSRLQVRADVRLEDVPQAQLGQPVEISTAALRSPVRGEVIAVTSQADIQKNTLQVKVAIHDPPAVLKPEMLVQVTFMAPEQAHKSEESEAEPLRRLIPRELVQGGKDSATVWVADLTQSRARLQSVQLGQAGTAELVEVTQGLNNTDKLIVSGRETLQDGERIQIVGEDKNFGVASTLPLAADTRNQK